MTENTRQSIDQVLSPLVVKRIHAIYGIQSIPPRATCKFRLAKKLSRIELAKELHVSKQCVSNWENDNIQPSVDMLVKIAKAFQISTDALLGLQNDSTISTEGLSDGEIAHIRLLIEDLKQR